MRLKRFSCCGTLITFCVLVIFAYFDILFLDLRLQSLDRHDFLPFNEANHHETVVQRFFNARQYMNLSPVGEIIYRNFPVLQKRPTTYKIVIWKVGEFLEARHCYSFTEEWKDPFGQCSVNNCELSYKDEDVSGADAVVFLMQRLKNTESLPNAERSPSQRWVFLTDESPRHTFITGHNNWTQFHGYFNWSMTFRSQSDVPVPYGRTLALPSPVSVQGLDWEDRFNLLVPNAPIKRRDVLVAVLTSNCQTQNKRLQYVRQLQEFITVDIYGGCGDVYKNVCPKQGKGKNSRYGGDCPPLNEYLFYLSFENSNCNEYITEKPFWNGFRTGAVPITMGPSSADARLVFPPNSFIQTDSYPSPLELANHLLFLNSSMESYMDLHDWRRNFEARNEHGLFGAPSMHYCRLCEALNYNSEEPKVYDDLSYYLDPTENCW